MGETWKRLMGRRELVLYIVSLTLAAGFILGKVSENNFMAIATLVVGFYFGQRMVPNGNASTK